MPSRPRCFNEAEAIKPRKRDTGNRAGRGDSGFNEAEAIKPRKPDHAYRINGQHRASMRPRQSSLGNLISMLFI